LFLPGVLDNLQVVDDSFDYVAAKVAAARAQTGVSPETYPLSGATVNKSRPEWYTTPYEGTTALDGGLAIQETGDVAHRNPVLSDDNPWDSSEITALQAELATTQIANAPLWTVATAYLLGATVKITDGKRLKATTAGTSHAATMPT
jgi:hypothetical protein